METRDTLPLQVYQPPARLCERGNTLILRSRLEGNLDVTGLSSSLSLGISLVVSFTSLDVTLRLVDLLLMDVTGLDLIEILILGNIAALDPGAGTILRVRANVADLLRVGIWLERTLGTARDELVTVVLASRLGTTPILRQLIDVDPRGGPGARLLVGTQARELASLDPLLVKGDTSQSNDVREVRLAAFLGRGIGVFIWRRSLLLVGCRPAPAITAGLGAITPSFAVAVAVLLGFLAVLLATAMKRLGILLTLDCPAGVEADLRRSLAVVDD